MKSEHWRLELQVILFLKLDLLNEHEHTKNILEK